MDPNGNIFQKTEDKEGKVILKDIETGVVKTFNEKIKNLMPVASVKELDSLKNMNRHERRKFYALNKHRIK